MVVVVRRELVVVLSRELVVVVRRGVSGGSSEERS